MALSALVSFALGVVSCALVLHGISFTADTSRSNELKVDVDVSDSDEDEEFSQSMTEYKMILVVRTDLGMTKGKAAAQCCHAAVGCYRKVAHKNNPSLLQWLRFGQPKITVQTKTEDSLLLLQAQAESLNITSCLIHDAGRTQIAANSATVLGLGPAPKPLLDQITGNLKLY
ncbi:peptidyl-tRNA hydrolase [Lipomyces japonicus]|uniref:peptidyl-tRNA hydrolase n=1 Tax=Lipomyces japonicus TaxID=56871 RepID=UPI0034CF362C